MPTCTICGQWITDTQVRMWDGLNRWAHYECWDGVKEGGFLKWGAKVKQEKEPEDIKTYDGKVASRQSNLGFHLIGWEAVRQIGDVCLEGDRVYKDKAINGKFIKNLLEMAPGRLEEWIEERGYNHALVHLLKWLGGDRTENHMAKVAWFCMVMIELEHAKGKVKGGKDGVA